MRDIKRQLSIGYDLSFNPKCSRLQRLCVIRNYRSSNFNPCSSYYKYHKYGCFTASHTRIVLYVLQCSLIRFVRINAIN